MDVKIPSHTALHDGVAYVISSIHLHHGMSALSCMIGMDGFEEDIAFPLLQMLTISLTIAVISVPYNFCCPGLGPGQQSEA